MTRIVAPSRAHPLRVTTAHEAAARDQAAIAAGIPSFTLMLEAGTQTAAVILRDYGDRLARGVAVYAGPGNNGGDAWIVAAQLARCGVRVRVVSDEPPRTDDARRAERIARRYEGRGKMLSVGEPTGDEQFVVDGLLGTGQHGALRERMRARANEIWALGGRGATICALDIPTRLDANTGMSPEGAVVVHLTVTYGTIKRGLLLSRGVAGRIVLLDIGLGHHVDIDDAAWHAASGESLAALVPPVFWDAHKGRRGHLALIGGVEGMAGAIVLATRAALASGSGLVRAFVDAPSVPALQQSVPQAIASAWDADGKEGEPWGNALAIGPGLGRGARSESVLRAELDRHPGIPVVLDADALTLLGLGGGDAAQRLREWCGDRAVVCTPHIGEFVRLLGAPVAHEWDARVAQLTDFATRSGAVMLLKGTPTLIATPGSAMPVVMPRGSAVLATGGSGDLLTGIIGALLAQSMNEQIVTASEAALLGATVHGLAGERAARRAGVVRGPTLDDVLRELPAAWHELEHLSALPPGVLADLPAPEGTR